MSIEHDEIQTAIYQERERYHNKDMDSPTPIEINNGLCRMFARRVRERLGFDVTIESIGFNGEDYPTHAWIAYGEKYYDAEVPEGVDERSELPVFSRADICDIPTSKLAEVC